MTAVVTGSTGFIGRHLVPLLASRGEPVRAQYRDESKRRQYLSAEVEAIRGDVCDKAFLRAAVAGADVIYHCAAAHSTCSNEEIRRTNLESVRCLFEAVQSAGGRARIVFMSSINVLGNSGFADATEDWPRKKTNDVHVDLKIAAEELAEKCISQGMDIIILRPGLVYGPGDPHLQRLAGAIHLGKFVFIGSRDNIVPMVHVSDMVEAMTAAGRATDASRLYHITDGSRTTVGELVSQLARVLDCPPPKRVLPLVVPRLANSVCGLFGRSGPVSPAALRFLGSSRHVDISRARRELGFNPRVTLAEGIESMRTAISAAKLQETAA